MEDSIEEIWKPIEGCEGYFVSNLGNVKSNKNRVKGNLKLLVDKDGYLTVWVSTKPKRRLLKVHRLVAQAFVDNPENKPQVCHKDGSKDNNVYTNLYWGTAKENNREKISHGTIARGEAQGLSKLKKEDVIEIKRLLSEGVRNITLAKRFGVNKSTIATIKSGGSWSWLDTQQNGDKYE